MGNNMYFGARTWNPFTGCLYRCIYCVPSFQQQLKRWGKKNCKLCYNYLPHKHPERLNRIPSSKIVFVCGDGDISWCKDKEYVLKIIERIREHNRRCPNKIYYFQSKAPSYFEDFLDYFPENVYLLTTLETNRDEGYEKISKAPKPSERFKQFIKLEYPRKILTIEPIMDFNLDIFVEWVRTISPKMVYIGYNSKPKQVKLPEPPLQKTLKLKRELEKFTKVILKTMRE